MSQMAARALLFATVSAHSSVARASGELLEDVRVLDESLRSATVQRLDATENYVDAVADYLEGDGTLGSAQSLKSIRDSSLAHEASARLALDARLDQALRDLNSYDPAQAYEVVLGFFSKNLRTALGSRSLLTANCGHVDVGTEVVFDHVEAIIANDPSVAVVALAQAARTMDCMALDHSLRLNSALSVAYYDTLSELSSIPTDVLERFLLASLSNLFLMVLDETKVAGVTPLGRLIAAERDKLKEAFAEPTSAARQLGLWLREPSANRLLRVSPICEETASSPCVSASHLIDNLVDPMRLGAGNCYATEMLAPWFDAQQGYFCQRDICNLNNLAMDRAQTYHGASTNDLRSLHCNGGSGLGWSGAGGGASGTGGGLPSSIFSCATAPLSMGASIHQCVADAVRPADPVVAGSSWTRAEFPSGGECRLTTGGGANGPSDDAKKKVDDARAQAEQRLTEEKEERKNKMAEAGTTVTDADYQKGVEAVRQAKVVTLAKGKEVIRDAKLDVEISETMPDETEIPTKTGFTITADGKSQIYLIAESVVNLGLPLVTKDMLHEADHVILRSAGNQDSEDHHRIVRQLGDMKLCDDIDCASCNGATAVFGTLSACYAGLGTMQTSSEIRRPDLSSLPPGPLDDTTDPAWTGCFGGIGSPTPRYNPMCGLMDCGASAVGVQNAAGPGCSCTPRVQGSIPSRNLCIYVRCGDGQAASSVDGLDCGCGGLLGSGPTMSLSVLRVDPVAGGLPPRDGAIYGS